MNDDDSIDSIIKIGPEDFEDTDYGYGYGANTVTIQSLSEEDLATLNSDDCMVSPITASNTGDITINTYGPGTIAPMWTGQDTSTSITLGETDNDKSKVYIVEPWQSRKPIKIENGLWVSMEEDMISNDELKQKILDKLEETNPDIIVKLGVNPDNVKLVKSEVNLEINKESK